MRNAATDDLKALTNYLREVGATDIRLDQGAKHRRLVFLWDGRERFFVRPSTPGDTMRGYKNGISELRHFLGLVKTVKRVGERQRKRWSAKAEPRAECPALSTLDDWHASVLAAVPKDQLRSIADLAWLAFWRGCMARVGARSLL